MANTRITLRDARVRVQAAEPFKTANGQLYGEWTTPNIYVVYSYGEHWPLFVWDAAASRWMENENRYSVTTSKHRTSTHPHVPTELRSAPWLRDFIAAEIERYRASRLPLWYVRWENYDRRRRIELVEPAYSDDAPEGVSRGYMYVRAADELGAYMAALATTKRKKAA